MIVASVGNIRRGERTSANGSSESSISSVQTGGVLKRTRTRMSARVTGARLREVQSEPMPC